ncbi:hypothetical protein BJ508DRAFT_382065 [Ascobolus immersus RN42]|uniref:Uncharacterized protein n=1 Tax=Ascobolus immersus RN42 TaxID=1160509 RepID=A0A3N4H9K7_ASCIM|nr:hypothetical protein BJ508DRAFT_382065 [Ascobolus immersus RN42]
MSTPQPQTSGYTPEEHLLLNRFRPNSTGIGYLSLEIFANTHFWYDGKCDGYEAIIREGKIFNKDRSKLGKHNGVVSTTAEKDFLRRINQFVDTFYAKTREYGLRDITQHIEVVVCPAGGWLQRQSGCAVPAGSEDSQETKNAVRKALLQYLILTTHFHDKTLAYADANKASTVLKDQTKTWEKERADRWESCEFDRKSPPIVYDYTYANSLSIAELATIISLASPLTRALYQNGEDGCEGDTWSDDWGYFGYCEFLRTYLARRCGFDPEHVAADEELLMSLEERNDEDDEGWVDEDDTWETRKIFHEAVDTGFWRPGYSDKVQQLVQLASEANLSDWSKNEELYTTNGTIGSSSLVKINACLDKSPTAREKEHEQFQAYLGDPEETALFEDDMRRKLNHLAHNGYDSDDEYWGLDPYTRELHERFGM